MIELPKIVFIGRPNVGKSTLFNRLLGKKRALVHNLPGVTRDRMEAQTEWCVEGQNYSLILIDTGGLGGEKLSHEITSQVQNSLLKADAILLLFDAQTGLTPADRDILKELRESLLKKLKHQPPIFGIVNKVDAESHEALYFDFFSTGLDLLMSVSAEHGRGIEDLKKQVIECVCKGRVLKYEKEDLSQTPKIAVVGRPNVGKSTFVNVLLNEQRMITSPVAGTTIDAIDSLVDVHGKPYLFIDTAGIRRKSKTEQGVEVLSFVQAKKALERCTLALLLLDGEKGIVDQDEKIGSIIEEIGCSVILVINKWDTQKKNFNFTKKEAAKRIRDEMRFLKYAPLLFISALEKKGFEPLGKLMESVLRERAFKVQTRELTEWVRNEALIYNPKSAKFYLSHQTSRNPPSFACHVSDPKKVTHSLERHLMNAMRKQWGFRGTPLRFHFLRGSGR